jgi:hypothetical protein
MVNNVRILLRFVTAGTEILSSPQTYVRGPGCRDRSGAQHRQGVVADVRVEHEVKLDDFRKRLERRAGHFLG